LAISKILYMKDCGNHFHGKHLKQSLDYVMNPEKTQNGRLVGGMNCQLDTAFKQMMDTKKDFGKVDKRQGYHLIISFKEGEVSPDTAYEITGRFVKEYLGQQYEAVYCVHDNTDHVHSHIIFNSVSFVDGRKYRYEKGDWERDIQPITNRLCEEYGLSTIDIGGDKEEERDHYKEHNDYRDGRFVWSKMIARDLDACILQAGSFEEFVELLSEKGYEVKQGKHLAVKPPGMGRYRRCHTLGEDYTEERIRQRIDEEDLSFYQSNKVFQPEIVKCYVRRYKRAKLTGLQKRYYAKLYRVGKLKKRPYSQVWKYKDDIKKMEKLQQQYLFLVRHDVHSVEELALTVANLTDKRKEASSDKSRVYRARQRCKSLFDIAGQLDMLECAEKCFQNGDNFFIEEHRQWMELTKKLSEEGYSYEEIKKLRAYYKEQIAYVSNREWASAKELNLAKAIWKDMVSDEARLSEEKERIPDKTEERTNNKQPLR
jgi:hypothetical protein